MAAFAAKMGSVAAFHPGLGHFVTCEDLAWEFGRHHSVQTVGVSQALARPGSSVYQRWHEQVLRFGRGQVPRHGAIWLTYYPNVMVEWYPYVLVVSTLVPRGPQHTTNVVEFYYPEEITLFEREFVEAERAAYHKALYGEVPAFDPTSASTTAMAAFEPSGCDGEARRATDTSQAFYSEFGDEMQEIYEGIQNDPAIVAALGKHDARRHRARPLEQPVLEHERSDGRRLPCAEFAQ